MKVFLVKRIPDYDEYEATVIVAESMEQAEEIIKTRKLPNGDSLKYYDIDNDSIIKEISLDEPKEIYASFNAG